MVASEATAERRLRQQLREGADSQAQRVACIGDSLTRGDGLHEHPPAHRVQTSHLRPDQMKLRVRGSYPATLARLLGTSRALVRNFGNGAATACNCSSMPYVAQREFAAALRYSAEVVVLMLGTNDAKAEHWLSGPCSRRPAGETPGHMMREGLLQIIRALVSQTAVELLVLLPPPPVVRSRWGVRLELLPPVRRSIERVALQLQGTTDTSARTAWPPTVQCPRPSGAPPRVLLSPPLAVPRASPWFAPDDLHLGANGSALLACAVYAQLQRCGVRPGAAAGSEQAVAREEGGRSCWPPFCQGGKRAAMAAEDDGAARSCDARDEGVGAPFLFTGAACSRTATPPRAVCRPLMVAAALAARQAPSAGAWAVIEAGPVRVSPSPTEVVQRLGLIGAMLVPALGLLLMRWRGAPSE